MKTNKVLVLIIAVALVSTLVLAQGRNGGKRMYDPTTETTVKGTVEDVQQHPGKNGGGGTGTHLMLKTDAGTLNVHVGPTTFLTKENTTFAKGDQIEVTGSKLAGGALIAREIKKGDKTLVLRDKTGRPVWAGQGRGKGAPPQQ